MVLRSITVFILIIAFALHNFQRAALVIGYYTDSSAFKENCINKTRAYLNCNGHCVLMKKLKEEEKKEQQAPSRKLEKSSEVIGFSTITNATASPLLVADEKFPRIASQQTLGGFTTGIFHPPAFI